MARDVKKQTKDLWLCWDHSLPAWVRRLCAEAWVGLRHIPVQAGDSPCPSAQIQSAVFLVDHQCLWSVPKCCCRHCPQLTALGNLLGHFVCKDNLCVCSQKQEELLDPLSGTYNRLVFLPCLVYLHVRNVHFDKEIINKDHVKLCFSEVILTQE